MKERFLELLACPACRGDLDLAAATRAGAAGEIADGRLRCRACSVEYPITGGVPRFVPADLGGEARETADAFGWSWTSFDRLYAEYRQQLQTWIAPVTFAELAGRKLLDAGCGKGRHLAVAAESGVEVAVGVDLSCAADVAYRNTARFPNVLVLQGDLNRLPVKTVFDYGWSIGVVHHVADTAGVMRRIVQTAIRPGGRFSAWLYGRENNDWIVKVVNPIRKRFTSKMRPESLSDLSWLLAAFLYAASHGLYRPAEEHGWTLLQALLFYRPYITYLGRFDFEEIHSIVVDHLIAPVASYYTGPEVRGFAEGAGLTVLALTWVRQMSWAVYGERPGA